MPLNDVICAAKLGPKFSANFRPLLVTSLLLTICGSTAFDQQQKEQPQQHLDFHRRASAQLDHKVRQLAEAIVALLDLENANNEAWPSLLNGTNSSLLSQLLAGQPFHPTIGVSLDAEGQAAKHGSMAFVWSPNGTGWPSVFTNGSALLAGPPRAKSYSVDSKQKRTKRRIGSSGGRGSIRVSGAGGHGRGSLRLSGAAFRGSTSARATAAGRSRFSGTSAGIGGIRPHVWLFTGGSSKGMPYEWKDDARYEYEQDSDSDVVRFEISLCFGRHKSRESCSDKVDSMLGKLAREKYEANPWHKYNDVITFALIMLGLMVASCILGLILMAIKQRNC